jgi:hypothetical protein
MLYAENYFYLCQIPLSAEGPEDVTILRKEDTTESFPEMFMEYEKLRAHATNKDGLYSIVRADEIFIIIRTWDDKEAKNKAFNESKSNIITNLQHRVMQNKDQNAKAILKNVYQLDSTM